MTAPRIPVLAQYRAIVRHLADLERAVVEARSHLSTLDAPGGLRERVTQLEEQLSQLRAVPYMSSPGWIMTEGQQLAFPGTLNPPPDASFSDLFRGDEELLADRQRFYLEWLRDKSPVVDLGCGRGEMLSVLRTAGIEAVGVDSDARAVERARAKGLHAINGDLLEWIRKRPTGSVGAVVASHVLEHLPSDGIETVLRESLRILRPGGILVAETVNPHALFAFKTFWTDPTHRTPLFPEVLLWMGHQVGFARGEVVFPLGSGVLAVDRYQCGEYAILCRREGD